jgi:glycosyltransferase involved in cell wall biosynthesis
MFWPALVAARLLLLGRRPRPGPPVIAGLLTSPAGLGQGARLSLQAAQSAGIEVRGLDLCDYFTWHRKLASQPMVLVRADEGGTLILHLNPPELPFAILAIGRSLLKSKRILGYWHWELPRMPLFWRFACSLVDEVLVPSRFVAEAFGPKPPCPVRVVTHPVRLPIPAPLNRNYFGISENHFVCLTLLDLRSSMARKNPVGALQAFKAAFGDDPTAMLVVKVSGMETARQQMEELVAALSPHQNVMLLKEIYATEVVAALIRVSDVVISLHRSEGLGLVPAEAMYLRVPVVATAYSGNVDFMNSANSAQVGYTLVPVCDPQGIYGGVGQVWADPDIAQAANWLRRLRSDPSLRAAITDQAYADVTEYFSPTHHVQFLKETERYVSHGNNR